MISNENQVSSVMVQYKKSHRSTHPLVSVVLVVAWIASKNVSNPNLSNLSNTGENLRRW